LGHRILLPLSFVVITVSNDYGNTQAGGDDTHGNRRELEQVIKHSIASGSFDGLPSRTGRTA
jgi:hypothetical protein